MAPPTWVLVPDCGVHEEPVVESDQLEEGETSPPQITKPGRVHLTVQSPAYDGKYVCTAVKVPSTNWTTQII